MEYLDRTNCSPAVAIFSRKSWEKSKGTRLDRQYFLCIKQLPFSWSWTIRATQMGRWNSLHAGITAVDRLFGMDYSYLVVHQRGEMEKIPTSAIACIMLQVKISLSCLVLDFATSAQSLDKKRAH